MDRGWRQRVMVFGCLTAGAACAQSVGSGAGAPNDEGWTTLSNFQRAHETVERGLAALGGTEAIERAGGLALDGEGVVDLGMLLQGNRPFEGDLHPIEERLAILPGADRLVHEDRTPLNPDAASWQRTEYRTDGTYRINMETGRASWSRPANRRGAERTIPHYLLAEVLANAVSLRHLGSVRSAGESREAVSWMSPDRGAVTLLFDPATGLLSAVESIADLPVYGDARIRWSFLDYEPIPGLGPFPAGYTIHIDGARLREIRWTQRTAAPTGGVLEAPGAIELPPATPFPPAPAGGGPGGTGGDPDADRTEFDIRDLAPGVHLLTNLRTGFHVLFVDFGAFVVAVDAPAGWWELQELPPRDWARSPSPALGERYVEGIRSKVGDKPIRYVVLTHHHGDHAGGVRAFVERGATVLGASLTRSVVERTLAGSLTLAGRDSAPETELRFEAVNGERTIREGEKEMRILDVGSNPHSEGMLAVWLPGERLLYVSDLFEPWGPNASPSPDRIPVMRWFVQWLDASGLEPERIYAIHRAGLVSEANLEEIRRGMAADGAQ